MFPTDEQCARCHARLWKVGLVSPARGGAVMRFCAQCASEMGLLPFWSRSEIAAELIKLIDRTEEGDSPDTKSMLRELVLAAAQGDEQRVCAIALTFPAPELSGLVELIAQVCAVFASDWDIEAGANELSLLSWRCQEADT